MTSNHHRPPTEHWYAGPSPDRDAVGKRKVEQLQKQINSIEDEMKERRVLINKLSHLQAVEDEKKSVQDRVMERQGSPAHSSPRSQQRMLEEEVERLYGHDSKMKLTRDSPMDNRNVMQTVIQHRTKEFSQKQQEAVLQSKYLDNERRRLQDARQRVQEQRRLLLESDSPTGKKSQPLWNLLDWRPLPTKYPIAYSLDAFHLQLPFLRSRSLSGSKFMVKVVPVSNSDSVPERKAKCKEKSPKCTRRHCDHCGCTDNQLASNKKNPSQDVQSFPMPAMPSRSKRKRNGNVRFVPVSTEDTMNSLHYNFVDPYDQFIAYPKINNKKKRIGSKRKVKFVAIPLVNREWKDRQHWCRSVED